MRWSMQQLRQNDEFVHFHYLPLQREQQFPSKGDTYISL
jgi:hypothetical protein